jgi:hypothetical protein
MFNDYPHSKNTYNLKVLEFEISKNKKSIEKKISKFLYHM